MMKISDFLLEGRFDGKYDEMKDDAMMCDSKDEAKRLFKHYGKAVLRFISDKYLDDAMKKERDKK
jgi:hypothetical protein